ncbi:MAG: DNA polymerase I [Selenomonadaceae bacterium]|nr:DNA polymerase I [Selenomonadaceae bacterium]
MKERLMILDGSSLMFRAFYALPLLTSPQGEYTNAVHGFSNMLVKMIQEYKPDRMVVAFDKSRHTFRTELFADYKGTRGATPEEFSAQVPILRDFLDAWGIPFIEIDNYEADDIIGTIASRAAAAGGFDTLIVTGDRDAFQLIRPDVRVLYTKKGISGIEVFDEAAFRESYGFEPIRLIDLKGLMGDSSDNIPGVPGVGEKTAKKLLLDYGSMEGVFEHLGEISGKKMKERLAENQAQAELSKRLATIDCEAPVPFEPESYAITPDRERFFRFCDRYGLNGARKGFEKLYAREERGQETAAEALPLFSAESFDAAEAAADFCAAVHGQEIPQLAFVGVYEDRPPHCRIVGAGLRACGRVGFCAAGAPGWNAIWAILNDASVRRATIDLKSFYHAGGSPTGASGLFDVGLAGYLLDASIGQASVEKLRAAWLPDETPVNEKADPKEKAAAEAAAVEKLSACLRERMEKCGLFALYQDMELPLVEVLAAMEQTGVFLDRTQLADQGEAAGEKLAALEAEIYALAGHPFNVNSPKQLATVLFEELGLPAEKKTKSGFSTNAGVLENLRSAHPIIEKLLDYRLWAKLKSTYLDAMGELIDGETGRVHTSFNQMSTATGRLSSSDPNLQNIPVRTEEGKAIRRLFRPGEGYDYLTSADYSQIELRILAHLSEDENFVGSFARGEDIHARTASEVFGVPMDEVTPTMRRHAKAVNFGIVYGISDYGLSQGLGIPRKEAAKYIGDYFGKYGGVKSFIDNMVKKAREDGFVTTMFGRRRELPAIKSKNFVQRSLAERMAMNTPIQGTAADIIKLAMIEVYRRLREGGYKSRLLLQVHDELVLETTADEADAVDALLRDAMEHAAALSVPLTVDIHSGTNWADAK